MKKHLIILIALFFSASAAWSLDLSMSFGPWTFLSEDERIADGVYPTAGITLGWNDYLETELFVIAEAAPAPFQNVFFGGSLGGSLLGTRGLTYFNMYAQFDFLYGLDFSGNAVEHNRLLGLRLSPLVIGNGYNGHRDRIFTVGAFYNLDSSKFSFTWNILLFDVYLKWP